MVLINRYQLYGISGMAPKDELVLLKLDLLDKAADSFGRYCILKHHIYITLLLRL